jgi:uncharacterized protein
VFNTRELAPKGTPNNYNLTFKQRKLAQSPPRPHCSHHHMKTRFQPLFILLVCIFAIAHSLNAQEPKATKAKQFIYVLRLVPRLYADSAWTKDDNAVLERHFARFQQATKAGQLILAGRTSEPGNKTFGIAIFEAPDEDAARKFMQEDPAVAGGLMTAELHPFSVALQRKNP